VQGQPGPAGRQQDQHDKGDNDVAQQVFHGAAA
jgi:hypothetical protein